MGRLHNAHCSSHPASQLILHTGICPMPYNNLTLNSHTAYDMAIFPVAMRRLILIHEIHINAVIRNFLIELRMQMTKRLTILLQPQNPHFRRGKRMHPGDNTSALLILICRIQGSPDSRRINQRRLQNHFKGKPSRSVQPLHDLRGMLRHLPQALIPVQILGTCTKPEFVVSSCFHFTYPPEK